MFICVYACWICNMLCGMGKDGKSWTYSENCTGFQAQETFFHPIIDSDRAASFSYWILLFYLKVSCFFLQKKMFHKRISVQWMVTDTIQILMIVISSYDVWMASSTISVVELLRLIQEQMRVIGLTMLVVESQFFFNILHYNNYI